jgi:cell division protein FtsX
VTNVLGLLQMWLGIVIAVFVASIAIITYSVIWNFIYYYRDEIYITKLVWGANLFIYWPFVLQGMLYSFIAFALNITIFTIFLKNLNVLFWDIYYFSLPTILLLWELAIFLFIWWISWYFSSKKYLKQKVS